MQEKQLEQQAAQYEKKNKAEKERIKKALLKGDIGSAQIAAENAIRNKNEALNAMRMAARVDGVQSRVSHVQAQQQVLYFILRNRMTNRVAFRPYLFRWQNILKKPVF